MDFVNEDRFFWSYSKGSNSSTPRGRKEASEEMSSLFLADMGQDKGLRPQKPALSCPHPRLLWVRFTCWALCHLGRLVHL